MLKKKYLFDVDYQIEDEEPAHMVVQVESESDIEDEIRRCYMKEVGITREEFGDAPIWILDVKKIIKK